VQGQAKKRVLDLLGRQICGGVEADHLDMMWLTRIEDVENRGLEFVFATRRIFEKPRRRKAQHGILRRQRRADLGPGSVAVERGERLEIAPIFHGAIDQQIFDPSPLVLAAGAQGDEVVASVVAPFALCER